eukprot:TRINITY_DN7619_c0_g1_i1.p1 TRINITY_DN7619_c0_g1~~TRINITY_DN7619_c0_g1_i1.p1  ORF type:complete len:313 (-),score=68.45 TRINITY_DN7619_c0_g1_i1:84-1022(-)
MPIVVVTGGTGFLGMHVIAECVERKYTTRATVRNINGEKTAALKLLFPQVEVFEADLLKPGSFDLAVKGADYVIHVASPFNLYDVKNNTELIAPAVDGTVNVLTSVQKAGTVKRVVLTSSVSSVEANRPAGHVYTEEDWNLDAKADGPTDEAYCYGKRLAEETAYSFAKQHGINLVTFCPSFMVGPPLSACNGDALSVQTVKMYFMGVASDNCNGVVDVRDVAKAHVISLDHPNASGRYILSSDAAYTDYELSQFLAKTGKYTDSFFPEDEVTPENRKLFSTEKVRNDLGISFTPVQKAVEDMGEAITKLNM